MEAQNAVEEVRAIVHAEEATTKEEKEVVQEYAGVRSAFVFIINIPVIMNIF